MNKDKVIQKQEKINNLLKIYVNRNNMRIIDQIEIEELESELSVLKSAKEEVKSAEEILAKCASLSVKDIEFKSEVQIIRPSEAIEAIKEFHSQFQSVQLKEVPAKENIFSLPYISIKTISSVLSCNLQAGKIEMLSINIAELITEMIEFKPPKYQSVKGEGERTADEELPLITTIYDKARVVEYEHFFEWFNPIIKKLESYKHSEGKDMYPIEFIEWLKNFTEIDVEYSTAEFKWKVMVETHIFELMTTEEAFNHWSIIINK